MTVGYFFLQKNLKIKARFYRIVLYKMPSNNACYHMIWFVSLTVMHYMRP